jgi:hypothetical protein
MTVLETVRCPGCSTRFGLGPARVRPGIRRAKCFHCASIFEIEDVVARLLTLPSPLAAPDPSPSLTLEDLQEVQDGPDEGPATLPEVEEPLPSDSGSAPVASPAPAEGPQPDPHPDAPYPDGAGNFASAKDAIAKLMGQAPVAAPSPVRMGSRSTMDVEATLDALETTLGGIPLGGIPAKVPDSAPAKSDFASTVKLTSEEIKVAMAAMGDQAKAAAAAIASAPPAPRMEYPPRINSAPVPPAGAVPAQMPDLLKIQLEQETCNNVTIEQMTAWIEQGRVHEYHLVARQFSEHWIEASKVPALRPIFDRMWKIRGNLGEEAPIPAPEPPPVKRGLFSGLFGRG